MSMKMPPRERAGSVRSATITGAPPSRPRRARRGARGTVTASYCLRTCCSTPPPGTTGVLASSPRPGERGRAQCSHMSLCRVDCPVHTDLCLEECSHHGNGLNATPRLRVGRSRRFWDTRTGRREPRNRPRPTVGSPLPVTR
jgi:hypothetical protein